jgi:lipopolysaccharide biosynthesis glycosyltransferase
MRTNTITVVVVSDDHYFILLGALIKSIEQNLNTHTCLDLWVVEENVSSQNKKKLTASIDPAITTVHWKSVKEAIPAGTKLPADHSSFPLNVYSRLFIPDFVPQDVEKVLYLDADMVVLRDITELWDTQIGDNYIAAVMDPRVQQYDNDWGGIFNYKELGFPGNTKYFNTGMMLLNIPKWRKDKVAEKVLQCIHDNIKYVNYPDQYGLNIVFANKWKEIDSRWNHFSTIDADLPYLIHFVQRKPIYKSYNYNAGYQELFYKYLKMSAWKNAKPIGESARYVKKIRNILAKVKLKF